MYVFRIKSNVQFYQSDKDNYCEKTMYNFAFGIVVIHYIFFGLFFCSRIITCWKKWCVDP